MPRQKIFVLMVLLSASLFARAEEYCAFAMRTDGNAELISYLEHLLEVNEIDSSDLATFRDDPHSLFSARKDSAARIHGAALGEYFKSGALDLPRLKEWATATLATRSKQAIERENVRSRAGLLQKMIFHRVEPGSIGDAQLLYPIAVMETLVTQAMWVEIMGENPSASARLSDAVTVMVDGRELRMQPDHPVEEITWMEAARFANLLSIRDGFAPVYDLSLLEDWESDMSGISAHLPPPAKFRDRLAGVTVREGYRFPTAGEIDFLLNQERLASGDIAKYAWTSENGQRVTQAVASLQPLILNGNKFFDLIGNVAIIGTASKLIYCYGPSVFSGTQYAGQHSDFFHKWNRSCVVGLRLVRTLKKAN